MSISQTHFQNARNLQVHNSQFTNIGGNLTINNRDNNDSVSTILWPHVAPGAIFDSAERYAAGKCHPGTRKKIIERITLWIAENITKYHVLWLHGPAGAGKSAIEHTICEILKQSHPESFAASFFFKSGDRDRGNAIKLFTTLAYQLALHFPSIRSKINDVLSDDPSLPTKSMEIQFLSLIGQPLLDCQNHLSHSPILVIDGLDECADDEGTDIQRNIITLIGRLIVEYDLPLQVMVASRPEYWIRDAFDTAPLPSITQVLSLRDDEDADKDIKAYLINGFEKIRVENKRVMRAVVTPWPPEEIIRHFVYQASGQYVYASTILKFVGNSSRFINPQKQLEIITSPGPNHALGFSELDQLYIKVLSTYPASELETLKRVLGGLLLGANASIITAALYIKQDDVTLVLDALSSLIDIQKPKPLPKDYLSDLESIFGSLMDGRDKISFCHLSFREFITDQTRSGPYHVDLEAVQREIARQFFNMFCRNLDQNYEIEPHLFVNMDHFTYHDMMVNLTSHCFSKHAQDDTLVTLLSCVAEKLVSFNLKSKTPDPLLCFMQDLERVESVLKGTLHSSTEEDSAYHLGKTVRNAVRRARQRSMHALSHCSTFRVTPTLVYFLDCRKDNTLTVEEVSTIPGTANVISTIRQHRHFLHFSCDKYDYFEKRDMLLKPMNLKVLRNYGQKIGSRIQRELKVARILLAYHFLKLILNFDEYSYRALRRQFLEHHFFNSKEDSDILTEKYFQDATTLSILMLMTDLAIWTRFRQRNAGWGCQSFTISMFCWFTRQLTNQQTLKLLQNHDQALQPKMTATMTFILRQYLLPHLTGFYTQGLCAHALISPRDSSRSISLKLKVLPLPQGFHQEEGSKNSAFDMWYPNKWQSLLDELFEKTGSEKPSIDLSCLYPHLASRLLFNLIRFLYGQIHPAFSTKFDGYEESFPYLTRCLPYAEPTVANMDAIRALAYLYPQSTWNPPEGFWGIIGELLQKYDHSILSPEELGLFKLWLESPDHADITTYIMTKQERRQRKNKGFSLPRSPRHKKSTSSEES